MKGSHLVTIEDFFVQLQFASLVCRGITIIFAPVN